MGLVDSTAIEKFILLCGKSIGIVNKSKMTDFLKIQKCRVGKWWDIIPPSSFLRFHIGFGGARFCNRRFGADIIHIAKFKTCPKILRKIACKFIRIKIIHRLFLSKPHTANVFGIFIKRECRIFSRLGSKKRGESIRIIPLRL